MRRALTDPNLFGLVLSGDSWLPWRVILIAAMGEPLTDDERVIYTKLTGGREREPLQRVEELTAVVGRRGGKSRAMAVLAAYVATCLDWSDVLVKGEKGIALVTAPNQKQAGVILDYAKAAIAESPLLRTLVIGETADNIELTDGISIEVRSSNFRRLRGPTYITAILDEVAFMLSEEFGSSNPDTEIVKAIKPGLSSTGGMLVMCSSPYAKRGALWDSYRRNFGASGDPLLPVVQADTRTMNPNIPQRVIEREFEKDAASAAAEYGAQFRTDVESFVSREAVEACVAPGIFERAYTPGVAYRAFVDPSGGSSDSFCLAIGHREKDGIAVLDATREVKPPLSPEAVCAEFSTLLKSYRITKAQGDRYAGGWPVEQFSKHGIKYEQSAKPKSEIYQAVLPLINSGKVDLLDDKRLVSQIAALERRTARGGKDSIDHPPGGHDDLCNAVLGVLSTLAKVGYDSSLSWVCGENNVDADAVWRHAMFFQSVFGGGRGKRRG
jgi:hypothetical protein